MHISREYGRNLNITFQDRINSHHHHHQHQHRPSIKDLSLDLTRHSAQDARQDMSVTSDEAYRAGLDVASGKICSVDTIVRHRWDLRLVHKPTSVHPWWPHIRSEDEAEAALRPHHEDLSSNEHPDDRGVEAD
eukprot:TRINITY_DN2724_c2_g1_i1.p1 TRINITY_DN2724_c2_g1~~TRINITY_DN2724_c2_g1_i1.p1  ORF type:complete len:133 (-),score=9.88 TRINITY_DN2724_c2_g1_i1:46-444(-)